MNEPKPTSRPWEAAPNGQVWRRHPACDRMLCQCCGYEALEAGIAHPRDRANGELIARAVNAHDDLVEALRAIARQPVGHTAADSGPDMGKMCRIASAALAKATE